MIEFSTIGESCTMFERTLLASTTIAEARTPREQWVTVAKRIGADAIAIVLDEFGNSRPYVQDRGHFFADLFRPYRIRMILDMRRAGLSGAQIAQRLGVSERTIDNDFSATFAQHLRCQV